MSGRVFPSGYFRKLRSSLKNANFTIQSINNSNSFNQIQIKRDPSTITITTQI
jgi:hypothetical protein